MAPFAVWQNKNQSDPIGHLVFQQHLRAEFPAVSTFAYKIYKCAMVKSRYIGDGHPTFNRNPYNGYINPYYWVDDHPLLYGNNGSLDPDTNESIQKNKATSPNDWHDNEAISTSDSFRSIQGVPQRMGIRRVRVDHPCSKTEGSGYQIEETSGHYAYVNQLDQIQSLRFPHEDATRRRVGKLLKAVLKTTNQQPIKRHLLLNFHCKAIHSRFAIKVTTSQCRTSTLVATCGKCNTFGKNSITKESIPACCHS